MLADIDFWHRRYAQQVSWSLEARRYIFNKIGLKKCNSILEVGCGSGALLSSLYQNGYAQLTGLDIDLHILTKFPMHCAICADAHALPIASSSYTVVICHFLLLWLSHPHIALKEMRRAAQLGGWVIALAEPDYSARVDNPPELLFLGRAQTKALIAQGANVTIGAFLGELFEQAGLVHIETGIIQPKEFSSFNENDFEMEWAVLRRDLAGYISPQKMRSWYHLDRRAALRGESIHYVPIHFAFGQKI